MTIQSKLTGQYLVVPFGPAKKRARKLCETAKHYYGLRRQALKLRFWPENHPEDENGMIIDLNWEWIRSAKGLGIGELRISDEINGNDNLRLIFFVAEKRESDPLPIIWILNVLQKKSDDFSASQIKIFKANRTLVLERFYRNPMR